MTRRIGIERKGIKITVEHFPYRKKPALAVEMGNSVYKVASFNSEKTADWFIEVAKAFFNGISTEEIKRYEITKEVLEKQMPKPLIEGRCPACNANVFEPINYCSNCGQKIDWGELKR